MTLVCTWASRDTNYLTAKNLLITLWTSPPFLHSCSWNLLLRSEQVPWPLPNREQPPPSCTEEDDHCVSAATDHNPSSVSPRCYNEVYNQLILPPLPCSPQTPRMVSPAWPHSGDVHPVHIEASFEALSAVLLICLSTLLLLLWSLPPHPPAVNFSSEFFITISFWKAQEQNILQSCEIVGTWSSSSGRSFRSIREESIEGPCN